MGKLTKKEREWVAEVQDVLNRCPSPEKIGFYTIGDRVVMLYDLRKSEEIFSMGLDHCVAVDRLKAGFCEVLIFPSSVESTAG
ncbi:hypothetical protein [Pectobacterium aroidearum]|uniref:hypothetical protein n=1 Tax=Pectobacterium aroidearum TaxID=1201031 RepID=UPI002086BD77|nr:hypothetical protein PEC301653_03580 [Pectobacterium carotovorum subsp. carotovorum]